MTEIESLRVELAQVKSELATTKETLRQIDEIYAMRVISGEKHRTKVCVLCDMHETPMRVKAYYS